MKSILFTLVFFCSFSLFAQNVGIGTTTPDTRLHLEGDDNNGTTATLKISSGSQNMLLDGNEIDSDNHLHLNFNSSQNVSIANGGGNVGIGTGSPNARLDVVAAAGSEPSIVTRGGQDYATASGQNITIGHWSGFFFTERLRIDPTGNVGIGNTAPNARLDVVANGSEPSIVTRGGADYAVAAGQYIDFGHWDGTTFTNRLNIHPNGNAGFNQIVSSVGLNVRNPSASNTRIFNTESANGTNRFEIWENGNAGFNKAFSNIGLNVRNPSASNTWIFNTESANGTSRFEVLENGNAGFNKVFNHIGLNVRNPSASNNWIFIAESTNGTNRFEIWENGNAGFNKAFGNVTLNVRGQGSAVPIVFNVEYSNGQNVFQVDNDVGVYGGLDFNVTGGGSKNFLIDHPLDPANKKLYHSCIEAPEQMTLYRGNVVLDANGEATVALPAYFEVLNADISYQLTCIGGYAPVFISEKIQDNQFKIAGGTSNLEVAWQVSGRRNDPGSQLNPYQVEVEKTSDEKGKYYAPEAYGKTYREAVGFQEEEEQLEK